MNLAGIVIPGDRVSAVPGKEVRYRNGGLVLEFAEGAVPAEASEPPVPPLKKHRFLPAPPPAPVQPKSAPPAPTLF